MNQKAPQKWIFADPELAAVQVSIDPAMGLIFLTINIYYLL